MRIYSIFRSLQGEGLTMGKPTVFVRTSGCPLRCVYCDTSQAFEGGKEMSLEEVVGAVEKHNTRNVCLTGGEPLAQKDAHKLIQRMLDEDHIVVVETSGAMPIDEMPCDERLSISMDIKCPSSGESGKMIFENIELLGPTDQLKFIISDRKDYDFAKDVIQKNSPMCEVIFTPVGGTDLKELAENVLDDGLEARVLPQLHKFIWGDDDDR